MDKLRPNIAPFMVPLTKKIRKTGLIKIASLKDLL